MTGLNWNGLTSEERLIAEQAVMNLRTLNEACDAAADGTVLAVAERLAMKQGRELIRKTLETSLDQQRAGVEKKGRRQCLNDLIAEVVFRRPTVRETSRSNTWCVRRAGRAAAE